jgi:hypothetical protein
VRFDSNEDSSRVISVGTRYSRLRAPAGKRDSWPRIADSKISIRLAIGASRGGVVQQLLIESGVIASLGAMAAIIFAEITVRGLLGEMGEVADRLQLMPTFLDARVLGLTFMLAGATTVRVGPMPAPADGP